MTKSLRTKLDSFDMCTVLRKTLRIPYIRNVTNAKVRNITRSVVDRWVGEATGAAAQGIKGGAPKRERGVKIAHRVVIHLLNK